MKKTILMLAATALFSGTLSADPQAIYDKHCAACHNAGLGGAPKPGDKAAWADRAAKGVDALVATVKSGKGAMPPKGTCASCDDDTLKGAVQIFLDQAK